MLVIGTSAYCGSGQDTLANEIYSIYRIEKFSMGNMVRKFALNKGISPSRENLQKIRKEYDDKYDRYYFPELLASEIQKINKNSIVTGIRTKEEVICYRKKFQFHLIFVLANETVRYERLLKRATERDPSNYDEFMLQSENEKQLFDLEYIKSISDHKIDCGMELVEMKDNIQEILNQIERKFIS